MGTTTSDAARPPSPPDRPLARRRRDRHHLRHRGDAVPARGAVALRRQHLHAHAHAGAGVRGRRGGRRALACLPRLSSRVRAWTWSLSGVVAYLAHLDADWLADGSIIASPILPVLAAASGGALVLAGALLAYSGACARSSAAPAA